MLTDSEKLRDYADRLRHNSLGHQGRHDLARLLDSMADKTDIQVSVLNQLKRETNNA